MKSKNHNHLSTDAPAGVVEIYASHEADFIEAVRRINEEGQVVRDMRGSVVEHPSLAIKKKASEMMLSILSKYALRDGSGADMDALLRDLEM